jgi:hypothetical protein
MADVAAESLGSPAIGKVPTNPLPSGPDGKAGARAARLGGRAEAEVRSAFSRAAARRRLGRRHRLLTGSVG